MKRIISVILCSAIFFGILVINPITVSAEAMVTSGITGECEWSFNTETGELTVSGNGKMEDYEIDLSEEGYGGFPKWYEYRDLITTITVESGVTSIGNDSFEDCNNLETVKIADTVTSIGSFAFINCNKLKSVELPNSSNLEIYSLAFALCKNLKSISFPEKLSWIGDSAFGGCDSLKTINIPKNVKHISGGAFNAAKIERITVDKANKYFCDVDGNLYNKKKTTLMQYAIGKKQCEFTVSKSVIRIKAGSFTEAKNLKKVIIPANVEKIEIGSFDKSIDRIKYSGSLKQLKKTGFDMRVIEVICKFKHTNKNNTLKINETDGLKLSSNLYTKDNPTSFKSSNPKIVRVSKNGRVRALKKGTATITVKRNGISTKIKVNVK